ncbi:MAG: S8 family serine peptidase [Lewinellaceae bacterium]|nr:S8 family serine peptidase [Lewinellaceae bacterium]MCB9286284.1 S8 family serine peptidase [Lewinellaceae bacterium]
MKRHFTYLALFFIFLFLPGRKPLFAQLMDAAKITEPLLLEMEAAPNAYFRAYALLADRVNPREMEGDFRRRKAPIEERVYELITALQSRAEATQPALLAKMESLPGIRPESFQPLWITNIIYFEGTREAIAALSLDPAVGRLGLNEKVVFEKVEEEVCLSPPEPNSVERGLQAIGAPQMWAMGYTGYGRRAMIVDTGQDPTHPALHNQFLYHNRNIGEAWRGSTGPEDCDIHGTHVTGTVLGLDRIEHDTIGVAFDAKWMGGIALDGGCSSGTDASSINGMYQWALNPDGNPSTVDDIPDVINNSWYNGNNSCNANGVFETYDALYAAGIAVVFSAGNNGPDPSTITPPKFNNWDTVRLFAVANLDANNPSLPIANSSSRGPSICGGEGSLLIKPEVAAPGSRVRSSIPGGYTNLTGTSMAAPHVSGSILLLKEAFPYLTGEELMLALYYTCTDLGVPGEDNDYGMGIINVSAAFEYLVGKGHEPVPPLEAPNDVVLLRLDAPAQNCNLQASPTALVLNNSQEAVSSLHFRYAVENYIQEYDWEGSLMPGATVEVRLPPLEATSGEFVLDVEVTAANGEPDMRNLNNRLKKAIRIVEDEKLPARAVGDAPVCRNSNALVESLYEGEATFRWYDEEEGGNLLGEGRSLLIPVGNEPRTVYAQVTPRERMGLPDKDGGGTVQFAATSTGLRFNAYSEFTLRSVKVYAEETGGRLFRLMAPDGSVYTKVASIHEVGENRIELGFRIEPGEGYELELQAGKPLAFNLGGTDYPYEVPGVASITGSTGGPVFYYFFYDWEIEYDHFCGRTPVEIEPAEQGEAPLADFNVPVTEINLAEASGELSFYDESSGAVSWLWNFGDGILSTDQNPIHTYVDTGSFQITLTVVGEDGCSSSAEGSIVVIEDAVLTNDEAVARAGSRLHVYPNPAGESIFLAFDLEKPALARYHLTDLLGRPVLQGQQEVLREQAMELSLAELAAGAYLMIAEVDGQRFIERVVKSR